jgi:hypothetical protein
VKILGDKAKRLSKETGDLYHTIYSTPHTSPFREIWNNSVRPTKMLVTQPLLQIVSLFMAFNFRLLLFLFSTYSRLYTEKYGQSTQQSSLHYLALAIGYTVANFVGRIRMDMLWKRLQKRGNGDVRPEYRVPLMIPGGILIPVGLFWYGVSPDFIIVILSSSLHLSFIVQIPILRSPSSNHTNPIQWSAQSHLHWIMPDIGIALFGCGFVLQGNAQMMYILDTYPKHTASASAASQVLKFLAGFVFPIFAPAMYGRLDLGWGNSVLGFISLGFGLGGP